METSKPQHPAGKMGTVKFSALFRLLEENLVTSDMVQSSCYNLSCTQGLRLPLLATLSQRLLENDATINDAPFRLLVTATTREQEQIAYALTELCPEAEVVTFPAWETLPHERQSPSAEIIGQRFLAIDRVRNWQNNFSAGYTTTPLFFVASARSALQPIGPELVTSQPLTLRTGQGGLELEDMVETLIRFGFDRVDLVSRRGEFAVRGGIIDVFSSAADRAIRVDFFGDEVDSLKYFDVSDQRSFDEQVETFTIYPASEYVITEEIQARAKQRQHEFPALAELFDKVSAGIYADGFESLAELLNIEKYPLTEVLPSDGVIAIFEPERVKARIGSLSETNQEFYQAAWDRLADATIETLAVQDAGTKFGLNSEEEAVTGFLSLDIFESFSTHLLFREHLALPEDDDTHEDEQPLGRPIPRSRGNAEAGFEHVAARLQQGTTVIITGSSQGILQRARQLLSDRNIASEMVKLLPDVLNKHAVYLIQAELEAGFELDIPHITVMTESDLFGVAHTFQRRVRRTGQRSRNRVDPLQLTTGDYVVHAVHGVGRFIELTKRKVKLGGRNPQVSDREYLVLEYAPRKKNMPPDRLYVPSDQLDLLSRYVGGESPKLNKMGGSDWQATKSRARKAVRELAVDLVKLYSARMSSKGYAFSADSPWQREMEDSFAYIETHDQMSAIDDVKQDMEREIPMDRLILGDVGYGKTEIAIRAAFKAIQDGKQVVLLVPTTLLVKQHYDTFVERFAGFPVTVRQLSRFQTAKEAKETIAGLAEGSVDIVIGTHRVLSSQVIFRDLGLVIIDEEQRFGVDHKEALKALKENVDMLAMSATPIPRTLEMAITGIREMSTLNTAPEDRHPILTYVGPRNNQQIAAAIRRELLREGQVFFVHNRVSSITRVAAELQELVPEARIGIAHGKLSETQLEKVIVDFWQREYDVLVCTTIIETGIDIPNANTLIIDQADRYGISQLHQIRGRVGRSRERAYAYFLYDPAKQLSETAYDRLSTIASNNELGAGMQVAMKDLELRGAGDLLGAEQSGHIAGVGFDLYLRMVGEAVDRFRGVEQDDVEQVRIEIPVRAFIPESYVDSERLRLDAYQKISVAASSPSPEALKEVKAEFVDRYGVLPEQAVNLFRLAHLRQYAQAAGITEVITVGGNQLKISGAELPESKTFTLKRLYPEARYVESLKTITMRLPDFSGNSLGHSSQSSTRASVDEQLIEWIETLLSTLFPKDSLERLQN